MPHEVEYDLDPMQAEILEAERLAASIIDQFTMGLLLPLRKHHLKQERIDAAAQNLELHYAVLEHKADHPLDDDQGS